jgi:hypothetical protein
MYIPTISESPIQYSLSSENDSCINASDALLTFLPDNTQGGTN